MFGNVFSNKRAMSGSFNNDFMSVMTFCQAIESVNSVFQSIRGLTSTAVLLNVRHPGSGRMKGSPNGPVEGSP